MAKIEHEKVLPLLIDENGEKLLHALYFTRWSTTSKTTSEEDLCKMVVKGDMVTYEGLTLAEHTAEAQRYYAEDDKVEGSSIHCFYGISEFVLSSLPCGVSVRCRRPWRIQGREHSGV